jgi:hypothetical protein
MHPPSRYQAGQAIRVITAPFFLGTKMEAFRGRCRMDFQASHDLEDFVAVIEGRETIVQEIAESQQDLRDILPMRQRLYLPSPGFSTCFHDMSRTVSEFHSSADELHPLPMVATASGPRRSVLGFQPEINPRVGLPSADHLHNCTSTPRSRSSLCQFLGGIVPVQVR